jgi:glyoxylase-like metal-dependent hydrolase (beta-lactamase superfamily II)
MSAEPKFSVTPFTSREAGAWSNSYLVTGRNEALLFDVVQLRIEAGKLADMIAQSGKTLRTVLISHAHPDHFLGSDAAGKARRGSAKKARDAGWTSRSPRRG